LGTGQISARAPTGSEAVWLAESYLPPRHFVRTPGDLTCPQGFGIRSSLEPTSSFRLQASLRDADRSLVGDRSNKRSLGTGRKVERRFPGDLTCPQGFGIRSSLEPTSSFKLQASLRDADRTEGRPGDKSPGYYRVSLRDGVKAGGDRSKGRKAVPEDLTCPLDS
jgi:hypothetical protein